MTLKTITIILLSLALVGALAFAFHEKKRSDNIEVGKPLALHWACMDGCFNMLRVEYGNFSMGNKTLEEKHNKCAEICVEQYWEVEP